MAKSTQSPRKQLPYGVPDFLDLLPKNSSGRVRTIKDYDKPTGRIYTEEELLRRLNRSLARGSDRRNLARNGSGPTRYFTRRIDSITTGSMGVFTKPPRS